MGTNKKSQRERRGFPATDEEGFTGYPSHSLTNKMERQSVIMMQKNEHSVDTDRADSTLAGLECVCEGD